MTIETGKLAAQASGSLTILYGDTLLLATACASPQAREGVDFLPLTIDYEEKLYAAGKIPGSFFRREGRPTQNAILTDRLTDRPLRPLFPKGFHNELQVVITTLSSDQENQPDILSIIGASAALSISDIPFDGPVAATRIGHLDGQMVVNPTFSQLQESLLDIVVAGTKDAIIMVEAGAQEVSEDVIVEALRLGQETNQKIIALQEELMVSSGKTKMEFTPPQIPEELEAEIVSLLGGRLADTIYVPEDKPEREAALRTLQAEIVEKLGENYPPNQIASAFDNLLKSKVRSRVLEEGIRTDGRGLKDIRPITTEVGLLPRTHGSGLFTRGLTQILSIATLGSLSEMQKLDTISPEEHKRYLHHYNFPGFSTGEVRRLVGPGRREIGHGALAERALLPVIPTEEDFPYTIRIVSEALSSNGSTSMGSVCGSTLALMDAGVPIRDPVAGVAMGLVASGDGQHAVLTDIQGIEDHLGDMDFKVAGTAKGITALQMDIKVKGISYEVMIQALDQARDARIFILGKMAEAITETRSAVSPYAPRMQRITIPTDKIGALIGPGGKNIRSIIEEHKVTIDVDNDGTVTVGSTNEEGAQKALEQIKALTKDVEVGEIYTGKVVRLMAFGAFVEILPGKDGLVHISELADHRVGSVEEVVSEGDELKVKVTEIDRMGRINLSHRATLEGASQVGGDGAGTSVGPRPSQRQSGPPYRRQEGRGAGPGFQRRPGPPRDNRRRDPQGPPPRDPR